MASEKPPKCLLNGLFQAQLEACSTVAESWFVIGEIKRKDVTVDATFSSTEGLTLTGTATEMQHRPVQAKKRVAHTKEHHQTHKSHHVWSTVFKSSY